MSASAQVAADESHSDSLFIPRYQKVMVIPFDMTYYLSDADHDLAKANGMNLPQVQAAMRSGVDIYVASAIAHRYQVKRIMSDTLLAYNQDLRQLYGSVRYRYVKPNGKAWDRYEEEKPGKVKSWFKDKFKKDDAYLNSDEGDAYFDQGKIRGPVEGQKVMHADLRDTATLRALYEKHGTDLFVFINQMELQTRYEHCLDRATNNFARDITIHYSIYDHTGKNIARSLITLRVGSNNRAIDPLMQDNFPKFANQIATELPRPRWEENKELSEEGKGDENIDSH